MLEALLLGSLALLVNLAIQIIAIVLIISFLLRRVYSGKWKPGVVTDMLVMGVVLFVLFLGHDLQFAIWAALFVWVGEFDNFAVAFYHSAVNFTSLGYGDIVMSEKWRLLGAIEAANGILMFGLTASSLLTVMNKLFSQYSGYKKVRTG